MIKSTKPGVSNLQPIVQSWPMEPLDPAYRAGALEAFSSRAVARGFVCSILHLGGLVPMPLSGG